MKNSEYKKLPLEIQLKNANFAIRLLLIVVILESLYLIFNN